MISKETTARLTGLVAASTQYCALAEQCSDYEREEWVKRMVLALPTLYIGIQSLSLEDVPTLDEGGYLAEYVDEDLYEKVRRSVAALLGEDDVYLETFEEDMKYSDTPIAATISEGIADIFQSVYNYVGVANDSDGDLLGDAFRELKESFESYWSQILCNTLRALNALLRQ
ncbi:MAG: DUF5063 domain-containing protein [Muribaculaceae bacterium]|nr:DUF5063 domain-containing protein [Muribaculaceae bacterium]